MVTGWEPSPYKIYSNYRLPPAPPNALIHHLFETENSEGVFNGIKYKYVGMGGAGKVFKIKPSSGKDVYALKLYWSNNGAIAQKEADNFEVLAEKEAIQDVAHVYRVNAKQRWLQREYISANKQKRPEKIINIAERPGRTLANAAITVVDGDPYVNCYNLAQDILFDLEGDIFQKVPGVSSPIRQHPQAHAALLSPTQLSQADPEALKAQILKHSAMQDVYVKHQAENTNRYAQTLGNSIDIYREAEAKKPWKRYQYYSDDELTDTEVAKYLHGESALEDCSKELVALKSKKNGIDYAREFMQKEAQKIQQRILICQRNIELATDELLSRQLARPKTMSRLPMWKTVAEQILSKAR